MGIYFRWGIYILLSNLIVFCSCSNNIEKNLIFVSNQGNDSWTGTINQPVKSLNKAISMVADRLVEHDSIQISFREGKYIFDEALVIKDIELSSDQHLVIKSYENEEVIFSSGKQVDTWKKLDHDVQGFNDEVKSRIWYTDIPKGQKFYTLYNNEKRLPRARTQGYLPTVERGEEKDTQVLNYPEGSIRKWKNLEDVEIIVRPGHAFVLNILPVEKVDESANKAYTSIPATYQMTQMAWLYEKLPELFWVENVPEALDEPGEWMLNSQKGKLYYLPLKNEPGEIFYPQTVELIRLEGSAENPLKNISIEGIAFTQTDRYTWKPDDIGLQHDWDIYDASTAMVRLVNTENCRISDCKFSASGSSGIRFDFHSQYNQVTNNQFFNLGGTPVLLSGYGPGTKDVNKNNKIQYNEIYNSGEIYWHAPAIFIWQSGNNKISQNLIYNMPYNGICLSGVRPQYFDPDRKGRELSGTMRFDEIGGAREWEEVLPYLHTRDNDVSFNEIHNVVQKLGDGNGIYISGGGHGNIISNNYIHDLTYHGVQGGIRTDDFQEGTLIKNNLIRNFYRKAISMKHTNKLINNVFIGLKDGVAYYGTPVPREGFVTLGRGPLKQSEIINNVFYQEEDPVAFIKDSPDPPRGEPALIEDCVVKNNIFWSPGNPDWLQEQLNELKSKGAPDPGLIVNPKFDFSDSTLMLDQNAVTGEVGIQSFRLPIKLEKELVP